MVAAPGLPGVLLGYPLRPRPFSPTQLVAVLCRAPLQFVYTHPVAKAVEYMVTDALLLVADELRILGEWLHDRDAG